MILRIIACPNYNSSSMITNYPFFVGTVYVHMQVVTKIYHSDFVFKNLAATYAQLIRLI